MAGASGSAAPYVLVEGVNLLYPPTEDEILEGGREFDFDVVFIHGLQLRKTANWWRDTWLARGEKEGGICWPQSWLPGKFGNRVRVLALEYDSSAVSRKGQKPRTLWETAITTVQSLKGEPVKLGDRPFFFVGHSMGGLLAKMILTAVRADDPLLGQCKGVVFYGVPHNGADLAAWGNFVGKLLKAVTNHEGTHFLEELKPNGDYNLRRNVEYNALKLPMYNFLENHETSIGGMVVPKADYGCTIENLHIDEADHLKVCRPVNAKSNTFTKLVSFMEGRLKEANVHIPVAERSLT